jgi:CHASE3 domain sensor protein
MSWQVRKPFRVFARGTSLRRGVAYSLGIVRLILVPVILLPIYYLTFPMRAIVDQVVNVDAPVATEAGQVSTEMQNALMAQSNYFLLHDPKYLQQNRDAMAKLDQLLITCAKQQPQERATIQIIRDQAKLYRQRLDEAVARMGQPEPGSVEQVQEVVRAYEKDLNDIVKHAQNQPPAQLMEDLGDRLNSFDLEITQRLVAEDPAFRQIAFDLESSSRQVLQLSAALRNRSWDRVQREHEEARQLVRRAEIVLLIVSGLTLLVSIWISFVLPRAVVRPLVDLREAIDRALTGDYNVEINVEGRGEIVELAAGVRELIEHLREKEARRGLGMRR